MQSCVFPGGVWVSVGHCLCGRSICSLLVRFDQIYWRNIPRFILFLEVYAYFLYMVLNRISVGSVQGLFVFFFCAICIIHKWIAHYLLAANMFLTAASKLFRHVSEKDGWE